MDSVPAIVLYLVEAKSGMKVCQYRLGKMFHNRLRTCLDSVGGR